MYADYTFYSTTYLGNAIPEDEFSQWSTRASSYLDYITMSRIPEEVPKEVEMACCSVADVYYQLEQDAEVSLNGLIKSERSGSYDVTYADMSSEKYTEQSEQRLYDAALLYLRMTGLLFGGVNAC